MNKIKTAISFLSYVAEDGPFKNRVYLAGGAVRDMQLGLAPKDIDIVVTGGINSGIEFAEYVTKRFGIYKEKSNPVIFKTYGTAMFQLDGVFFNLTSLEDVQVECVAARSEKYSNDSRKPAVSSATLEEDVRRRDFTINSLLINLTSGQLLDLTGLGVSDIKNKIIRTTSDPDLIFSEDPLRMLRAIRFSFKYGFRLDDEILISLSRNNFKIKNISQERIREEFDKILVFPNVSEALELMRETGLLYYFFPELDRCFGVVQGRHHTKDVFAHILDVIENSPTRLEVRLMSLFHDIAKPVTRTIGEDDVIHFYQHEKVGAEMSESIMRRLKYPNDMIDKVKLAVLNHMRLKRSGKDGSKFSDKSLRKFSMAVGDQLENILDLMHSDNISHSSKSSLPDQIPSLRKRFETLYYPVENNRPNIPIDGNDLIMLGLKPSKKFKELLDLAVDKWMENPDISKMELVEIIKERLKQ